MSTKDKYTKAAYTIARKRVEKTRTVTDIPEDYAAAKEIVGAKQKQNRAMRVARKGNK